jgi:hypothetical protein
MVAGTLKRKNWRFFCQVTLVAGMLVTSQFDPKLRLPGQQKVPPKVHSLQKIGLSKGFSLSLAMIGIIRADVKGIANLRFCLTPIGKNDLGPSR